MPTEPNFDRMFRELSAAVQLNKNDLDNQLCEHPELFRRVCELLSKYEDDLALMEAEVDREIRDARAGAKEKITNVEIERQMALDSRVGKLKLTVSRLKGLKETYIERRHAFSKLVDLHGHQYWSEPSGGKRSVAARDTNRERIRETFRTNRER